MWNNMGVHRDDVFPIKHKDVWHVSLSVNGNSLVHVSKMEGSSGILLDTFADP